tara:strand:- start:351 stop:749 length:399 start_codon:yes stop_codon:yes gene_type:complete
MNKIQSSLSINELKELRDKIQNISNKQHHHAEIFSIIKTNSINFSENKNGIFLNMNKLNDQTISLIKRYLSYIENQNKNFLQVENIKKEFKKDFFGNLKLKSNESKSTTLSEKNNENINNIKIKDEKKKLYE